MWTHKLWSTGMLRQIDYILVDAAYAQNISDCAVLDDLEETTDHIGLYAVFRGYV